MILVNLLMKQRTFFKIRFRISDLDGYGNAGYKKSVDQYQAELIIENENEVSVRIFYDELEYLATKVGHWITNNLEDVLSQIEILDIIQPNNLLSIDFSLYEMIGLLDDGSLYEDGNRFFVIKTNGVKKIYLDYQKEESYFYLNEQAFGLIEKVYKYHVNLPWIKSYKWEPENCNDNYFRFGGIDFRPEHNFYNSTNNREREIVIRKEPRISILHSNLSEDEVVKHVKLICILYSFYSQQNVEYFYTIVFADSKKYVDIKSNRGYIVNDTDGVLSMELKQDPLELIMNVDVTHLLNKLEFVDNIVKRFNHAMEILGESKFMILYNILEQIRNSCIEEGQNNDYKYSFIKKNDETNLVIKSALESIKGIVAENQKLEFDKDIAGKIKTIKLRTMRRQFDVFFEHLGVYPNQMELDFIRIQKLRNSVFHGSISDEEKILLKKLNEHKNFPRFVAIVILRYFGYNNIEEIVLAKM
ncbi:MAG: hypothetical protein K0R51_1401 [Cytophagaceae bacterium]|jgi:hypothetical protein|nr:hypothetical protein [Cytophagaceae bacterium]